MPRYKKTLDKKVEKNADKTAERPYSLRHSHRARYTEDEDTDTTDEARIHKLFHTHILRITDIFNKST